MTVHIQRRRWPDDAKAIAHIRRVVFIQEQEVPEEMEWDGLDDEAIHLLAEFDGVAVGCARVLADGHIGRMAVLEPWRQRGVGSALLKDAQSVCEELGQAAWLDAQVQAIPFYERHGFIAEGEVFMDAGIPHRRMRLSRPGDMLSANTTNDGT